MNLSLIISLNKLLFESSFVFIDTETSACRISSWLFRISLRMCLYYMPDAGATMNCSLVPTQVLNFPMRTFSPSAWNTSSFSFASFLPSYFCQKLGQTTPSRQISLHLQRGFSPSSDCSDQHTCASLMRQTLNVYYSEVCAWLFTCERQTARGQSLYLIHLLRVSSKISCT